MKGIFSIQSNMHGGKWEVIAPFVGLIIGMVFFAFHVTGFGLEFFAGDLGDARLNLYFLEHAHQYFLGKLDSYWDAPFMVPEPNVIAFSDNLLGTAPLYSSFRLFGADIFLAYQLWFLVICAFNYVAAYFFFRYLLPNPYTCALGAMVFAFSLALHSQLPHAQTFPRFAIPLAMWMAAVFWKTGAIRYFFLAVLFLVYQIYCGIYLGFLLAIPLGLFLLLAIGRWRWGAQAPRKVLPWWLLILLSVVANLAMLMPLMLPYVERSVDPESWHYASVVRSLPTLKSYISTVPTSLFWHRLSEIGVDVPEYWNQQIFTGMLASMAFVASAFLLLRSFFAYRLPDPIRALFAVGLITFGLFLRFDELTAYIAVYYLPGFTSLRALARIINVELLFFALSLSYVAFLLFGKMGKRQYLLFLPAAAVIMLDNFAVVEPPYRSEVREARERLEVFEEVMAELPEGATFSLEALGSDVSSRDNHLDAMLLAQMHGMKTVNAYTALCPSEYSTFWHESSTDGRERWLESRNDLPFDTLHIIRGKRHRYLRISDDTIDFRKADKIWLETKVEDWKEIMRNDSTWYSALIHKAKK